MAENATILSGGRAKFSINGQSMGFATGVSVTETITQEPAHVLDSLVPAEHVTTAYTVQLQCTIYKVPIKDLVQQGLWPTAGGDSDTNKLELIDFPEMSAEIVDYDGTSIMRVYRVKPQSRTVNFQARGIVMTNCTFVAVYMADEGSPDV